MSGIHTTSDRYGLIDPRVLQSLGNLRIQARAVVEGAIAGLHRSALKGASVEFTEYKEYSPGDDTRHIDWRTYARSDRYFVKQFEDETNLRAYLVLDCSGSMDYGFEDNPSKHQYAVCLAASFAYLFVRQGDAVGLLTFSGKPGVYLPASSKHSHLDDLLRVLEGGKPGGGTDMVAALHQIAERARARSLVFVITDLLDARSEALTAAKVLRQRRFEVALLHVVDQAEISLPFEGLTLFEGLEGEADLLVDPDDIRERYREEIEAHFARAAQECLENDIEYRRIQTTSPLDGVLMSYLFERGAKR